jgi:hypothetical protein
LCKDAEERIKVLEQRELEYKNSIYRIEDQLKTLIKVNEGQEYQEKQLIGEI